MPLESDSVVIEDLSYLMVLVLFQFKADITIDNSASKFNSLGAVQRVCITNTYFEERQMKSHRTRITMEDIRK